MSKISNDLKSNKVLNKITSKYIIKRIFDNLNQIKLLELIRYNKQYQKLMNKKFKDYKMEFSKIEIEIIPKENTYGSFINISNEKIRKNIHIYFNDNKEEIKKEKIAENDNVTKIKIIINNKIKSLYKFLIAVDVLKR